MTRLSILAILGRAAKHTPTVLTGATVILSADHRDQTTGHVHSHRWKITAWVSRHSAHIPNATYLQTAIRRWCDEYDGRCLPDRIAWGENIAADVARWLKAEDYVVRAVLVEREKEGLSAAWFA